MSSRFPVMLILFVSLISENVTLAQNIASGELITIADTNRSREIPTVVYLPSTHLKCSPSSFCKVALLSSGYGILNSEYSFIAKALTQKGYLVAAVQHELPDDPPLSTTQPYIVTRMSNWSRGVVNLKVAREHLQLQYPGYDWDGLLLVGHSNGGDISSLFTRDNASLVSSLVTIDHRRMPLPLNHVTRVLSIRGSDFEADPGVLPNVADQSTYAIEVVKIAGARHDDMYDGGSEKLRSKIVSLIDWFLSSE